MTDGHPPQAAGDRIVPALSRSWLPRSVIAPGVQVANAASGWRRLVAELTGAGVTRVGIEATGGYECGVVAHLRSAGFTVLVLQPIQVRAYARLHLRRAKNDALDAVLIAACAAMVDPLRSAQSQQNWSASPGLSTIAAFEPPTAAAGMSRTSRT